MKNAQLDAFKAEICRVQRDELQRRVHALGQKSLAVAQAFFAKDLSADKKKKQINDAVANLETQAEGKFSVHAFQSEDSDELFVELHSPSGTKLLRHEFTGDAGVINAVVYLVTAMREDMQGHLHLGDLDVEGDDVEEVYLRLRRNDLENPINARWAELLNGQIISHKLADTLHLTLPGDQDITVADHGFVAYVESGLNGEFDKTIGRAVERLNSNASIDLNAPIEVDVRTALVLRKSMADLALENVDNVPLFQKLYLQHGELGDWIWPKADAEDADEQDEEDAKDDSNVVQIDGEAKADDETKTDSTPEDTKVAATG